MIQGSQISGCAAWGLSLRVLRSRGLEFEGFSAQVLSV